MWRTTLVSSLSWRALRLLRAYVAYDACFLTVMTCVAAVVSLCVVRRLFPHYRDVRCGCRDLMCRTTLVSSLSWSALRLLWAYVLYDACFLTIVTCVAAVLSFCGVRRLFPHCRVVRCGCRELAYVAYDACFLNVVTCVVAVVSLCGVRRLFPHCRDVRCGCRELMWRTTLASSLSCRALWLSWVNVAYDACFLTIVTCVAAVLSFCGVRRLFPHCRVVRCGCRELAYVAYDACFLNVVSCAVAIVSLCGVRRLFPHCRDVRCGCRELMWRTTLASSLSCRALWLSWASIWRTTLASSLSWRALRLSLAYVAYDACFLTVVTCVVAVVS